MENNLTYTRNGDYLIPDLKLSEQPEKPLGKYGRMRKAYLKEHRPLIYNQLLLIGNMEPGETISLDNRQVTFCATNFSYALASQITGVSLYDRNGDMEDATYVQALERANLLSFYIENYLSGYHAQASVVAFGRGKENLDFLKKCHEPYVIIASGDGVYKLDYNKVLEYHIEKKADITVVCRDMEAGTNVERFGTIRMNEESRIEEFEEKPLQAKTNTISCGIYVVRRRLLIEMIEKCAEEDRYDFVRDILIRYKDLKRIYGYKIKDYWRNIASVDDYYSTNMDFLKADVRNYFFKQYPDVYSKVDDLPPAKYNPGSQVRNSLVSSGCIVNGVVENSVIFKKSYIGNNCVIKNSIILNDVYIGDNTHIENCIVESRDTIRANSYFVGEGEVKIVVERNERYVI